MTGDLITILAVYVDHILLSGNNTTDFSEIKSFLHSKFRIKDLAEAHYFLGMELVKEQEGLVITQWKFSLDLLQEYNCLSCIPVSTPIGS